jgi:hypothetical protein
MALKGICRIEALYNDSLGDTAETEDVAAGGQDWCRRGGRSRSRSWFRGSAGNHSSREDRHQ